MSLPAFSAIIASYVPNHGNLGPSGSYNAWVNKINTRKNACNSWATCTNTPDDIWNVKFDECDEGCSAQGADKCVSNFCDALADVYDYTRRLQSSDHEWQDLGREGRKGRTVLYLDTDIWPDSSNTGTIGPADLKVNEWIEELRKAEYPGLKTVTAEMLLKTPLPGCPDGCEGSAANDGVCGSGIDAGDGVVRNWQQWKRMRVVRNFCAAMMLYSGGGTPDTAEDTLTTEEEVELIYKHTDALELDATFSAKKNYILCGEECVASCPQPSPNTDRCKLDDPRDECAVTDRPSIHQKIAVQCLPAGLR